jgi:hypothetical protein
MSEENIFDHPDLIELHKKVDREKQDGPKDAWQYTPSRTVQELPGQTADLPRDPQTSEIILPSTHPYVTRELGEAAADAASRVNDIPETTED